MAQPLLQLLNRTQSLVSLKAIHSRLLVEGSVLSSDLIINKILRLYARFNTVDYAHKLFVEIPQPNAFLWTSLIHGYVDNREYLKALHVFVRMRSESVAPLNFTVASVLKALAREVREKDGEAVFGFILKSGFGFDLIVQNSVLDLFMRCGEVDFAKQVFDEMGEKDVVSWNTMISGYGNNGMVDVARVMFDEMSEKNTISWTSLICGYVNVNNMIEASFLFDRMPKKDSASWNVMLSAYIDSGDVAAARSIFNTMPVLDVGACNLMISGFCRAGDIDAANKLFNEMIDKNVVSWTILIDGYMKAGKVDDARTLFDEMPEKNLVSWSTVITGYAKNGQPSNALKLYKQFKNKGLKPDETFIFGIISACSQLGIIGTAESIVSDLIEPSDFCKVRIVTSLIDMYAKCGCMEKAVQYFTMADHKDLLCYSTMISAFANYGMTRDAISLFNDMQRAKIKPDGIVFLGVLTACNHGGLVQEGRKYFRQMTDKYKIKPTEKHYACVVDLFGRAGNLDEAHNIIRNMTITPSPVVWGALLAACRVHRHVQLAEVAAAELFKIEPHNSGNYILLSNTYAAAGLWDGVSKVRTMIRENHVKKNRGSSWTEVECTVHEFVTGDNSHIESETIYFFLDLLNEDMRLMGYHAIDHEMDRVSAQSRLDISCYENLEDG